MSRILVESRIAYRSQQHRRRRPACLDRIRRQRIVRSRQRRATDRFALRLELMSKTIGDYLQRQNRLLGNLRTNPVARQNRKFEKHEETLVGTVLKFDNA
jgi:siderophore synthetase component